MSALVRIFTKDRLHRGLALACATLVFALTIFAASPIAHQWLHADDVAQGDHDCAVVLFASGVSLPVGPIHVTPPQEAIGAVSPATAAEIFLVSPRYLRQPERGPPASWVS
jgi:hypothetical protein